MTANILSRSSCYSNDTATTENYTKLDPEKAKLLKNIRKDGQYLWTVLRSRLFGNSSKIVQHIQEA